MSFQFLDKSQAEPGPIFLVKMDKLTLRWSWLMRRVTQAFKGFSSRLEGPLLPGFGSEAFDPGACATLGGPEEVVRAIPSKSGTARN